MKYAKLPIILFFSVLFLASCLTPKPLVKVQTDSNNKLLPIEASEILAQVIDLAPIQGTFAKVSPCAKAPCKATIRIMQVLKTGQAFQPALQRNTNIKTGFAYTLAPTDSIFQQSAVHLPGLKKNDIFKAHIRIVGQNKDGQNIYEIGMYQKQ